jgi:serine/threonine protein kinase
LCSFKLCDFGLALWRTAEEVNRRNLSQSHLISRLFSHSSQVEPCKAAGSPGYMAPELLQVRLNCVELFFKQQ